VDQLEQVKKLFATSVEKKLRLESFFIQKPDVLSGDAKLLDTSVTPATKVCSSTFN